MTAHEAVGGSAPLPRPRARFRSLTHASFDPAGGGAGGWQVKDVSAGTGKGERARLEAAIVTRLTFPRPLSTFPGREEVEALPRRLLADPGDDGVLYAHAAAAGYDGTGRPGNVFSHVVLDLLLFEVAREGAAQRPVQMWRDPRWLAPFGHDQVLAATPDDDDPPAYGGPLTREACVAWLTDPEHYRYGTLALLLDAVAQQLAGGSPVVVVADDVDEGMRWLAVASWFAPAAVCTRLGFCSYVRWDDLLEAGTSRALTVVLREDLPATMPRERRFLLVDPQDEAETVDVIGGQARRTGHGDVVPLTDWSTLAQDACAAGPAVLLSLLEQVDVVATNLGLDADDCAWWPLAVGVAAEPSLDLSWDLAQRVVLRDRPDTPMAGVVGELVDRLLRQAAGSTEASWSLLQDEVRQGRTGLIDRLARAYLVRALSDTDWLLRADPPPVAGPPPPDPAGELPQAAEQTAQRIAGAWAGDPADRVLAALRLVDLVARAGVPVPDGAFGDVLHNAARTLVDPVHGPALAARAGAADAALLRLLDRPLTQCLALVSAPPGERVPAAVLEWAAPALTPGDLRRARGLAGELVVARALSGRALELRTEAARLLLLSDAWLHGVHPTERVSTTLARLEHGRPWSCEELVELVPGVVGLQTVDLVPAVVDVLAEDPFTSGARALADTLLLHLRNPVVETRRDHLALLRAPMALAPADGRAAEPPRSVHAVDVGLEVFAADLLRPAARHEVGARVLEEVVLLGLRASLGLRDGRTGTRAWRAGLDDRLDLLLEPNAWALALERLVDRLDPREASELAEVAARVLVLGRPAPEDAGPVRFLLQARQPVGATHGSVAEAVLKEHWRSRDRRDAEDARETLMRRLYLSTDDKQTRASVAAWWEQFLPGRRLLGRFT